MEAPSNLADNKIKEDLLQEQVQDQPEEVCGTCGSNQHLMINIDSGEIFCSGCSVKSPLLIALLASQKLILKEVLLANTQQAIDQIRYNLVFVHK